MIVLLKMKLIIHMRMVDNIPISNEKLSFNFDRKPYQVDGTLRLVYRVFAISLDI